MSIVYIQNHSLRTGFENVSVGSPDYQLVSMRQNAAADSAYRAFGVPFAGSELLPDMAQPQLIGGDVQPPTGIEEETHRYFYHPDHLGSTSLVTDRTGAVTQKMVYLPYGEMIEDIASDNTYTSPYKFNGKEWDEETGLYYYGARYYNPATALWLSPDPMQGKYPNISTYSYCHNNPINIIDPDGKDDIFNETGKFVERTQTGSSVYIQTLGKKKLLSSFDYNKEENLNMLKNVAYHYFKKVDRRDYVVKTDNSNSLPEGAALANSQGKGLYYVITNNGKISSAFDNMYNFENMAYHEVLHRYLTITHGGELGEVNAILLQTLHPTWNLTSSDFKLSQASYAARILNDNGFSIVTKMIYGSLLNSRFKNSASFSIEDGNLILNGTFGDIIIKPNSAIR